MKKHLLSAALACTLGLSAATAADEATPKIQAESAIAALKSNDLKALAEMAPAENLKEAREQWEAQRTAEPDPQQDQMMTFQLSMMNSPEASAMFVAQAQEYVATMPAPEEVTGALAMYGMLLSAQFGANPDLANADEIKLISKLIPKVQEWIGTIGYQDPAKAEKLVNTVMRGLQALNLKTAEDVRAMTFDDILGKGGMMIGTTKEALAIYDIDINAFLDSIVIGAITGEGDERNLAVSMTMFGEKQDLNVVLTQVDGNWMPKSFIALQEMIAQDGMGGIEADAPASPLQ